MKSLPRIPSLVRVLAGFLALMLCCQLSAFAESPAAPAGYWEGEIKLPGTKLAIHVDLQKTSDAWAGTIDIPVQGLRGFQLDSVTVDGPSIHFAMPNIPGDPTFSGKLAADGKRLAGDFTQGGQKFPFELEQKERPAASAGQTPEKGVPGSGLDWILAGIASNHRRSSRCGSRSKSPAKEGGELAGVTDQP